MVLPILSGPEKMPAHGNTPKQLVIFLHGLGADGNDLIGLAPFFAETLPDAAFISPNAPFSCDMAPFGHQWFSLLDRKEEVMLEGIQIAVPILNQFIDQQLKRFGLSDSQLFLVGFSQGTMMSLYTALRREQACAGIIGFSGALLGGSQLATELKSKPPVCLVHGTYDEVVPFGAMLGAVSALEEAGIAVESHARPGLGHGIDPEGIEYAKAFIRKVVGGQ